MTKVLFEKKSFLGSNLLSTDNVLGAVREVEGLHYVNLYAKIALAENIHNRQSKEEVLQYLNDVINNVTALKEMVLKIETKEEAL